MYATVDDLRAEGLLPDGASTERAARALAQATSLIDSTCGQFFEPRALSIAVVGRGAPTIWLPVPILRLDQLLIGGVDPRLRPELLEVVGAPVMLGADGPRITQLGGVFLRGVSVRIDGLWGYTEPDASPYGHTPYSIWRACLLLAARVFLPLVGDVDNDARIRARIISERTRDQEYTLADPASAGIPTLTGDPEVDALLAPYLRKPVFGAA